MSVQALRPALDTKVSATHLSRSQWMVLVAAFLGWMFDGVEQGVFPLVARPALQDLLGVEADKLLGPWMGYITALFLVGALIMAFNVWRTIYPPRAALTAAGLAPAE